MRLLCNLSLLFGIMLIVAAAAQVFESAEDWKQVRDPSIVTQHPHQYGDYIRSNPGAVTDCPTCYKQYITLDPANAGRCTECYEAAASNDPSILDNRDAFRDYASQSRVNFLSLDSSPKSFDQGTFCTETTCFSVAGLAEQQNSMRLEGFRISQDGKLELVQKGTMIAKVSGNVENTGSGLAVTGSSATFVGPSIKGLESQPIILDDGSLLMIRADGSASLEGTASFWAAGKSYEIADFERIVFAQKDDGAHVFRGRVSDSMASEINGDHFSNRHDVAEVFALFEQGYAPMVSATKDVSVEPEGLNARFFSDSTTGDIMFLKGQDWMFTLNQGVADYESGRFMIDKPGFAESTRITDFRGYQWHITDTVEFCDSTDCDSANMLIIDRPTGRVMEMGQGVFLGPFPESSSISRVLCPAAPTGAITAMLTVGCSLLERTWLKLGRLRPFEQNNDGSYTVYMGTESGYEKSISAEQVVVYGPDGMVDDAHFFIEHDGAERSILRVGKDQSLGERLKAEVAFDMARRSETFRLDGQVYELERLQESGETGDPDNRIEELREQLSTRLNKVVHATPSVWDAAKQEFPEYDALLLHKIGSFGGRGTGYLVRCSQDGCTHEAVPVQTYSNGVIEIDGVAIQVSK